MLEVKDVSGKVLSPGDKIVYFVTRHGSIRKRTSKIISIRVEQKIQYYQKQDVISLLVTKPEELKYSGNQRIGTGTVVKVE